MIESLLPVEPLINIDLEEGTDQVFALLGDGPEFSMVEMEVSISNLAKHFEDLPLEWKVARDHGVENDSKRPQVRLFTMRAIDYFRGHVVRSACDCLKLPLIERRLRQTKIDQAHSVALSYHDVVRLYVAVHYFLRMAVVDSLKQLSHVLGSLVFVEHVGRLLDDFLKQWFPRNVFHDQIDELLVVVRLVILHYIGVVQLVQDGNLIHNLVEAVRQFDLVQHFDGNFKARIMLVHRHENFAEGPGSKHSRVLVDHVVLLQRIDTLLSRRSMHGLPVKRYWCGNQLII